MKPIEVRFLLGHQHSVPLLTRAGAFVPSAKQALERGVSVTNDAGLSESEFVYQVLVLGKLTTEADLYPWRMPVGAGRLFSYDQCMGQFNAEMKAAGKVGLLIHCHANATAKGLGNYRGVYYDGRSTLGTKAALAAVEAASGYAIPTKSFECGATENARAFGCINGAFPLSNVAAILVETCFLDNPNHYESARSPVGIKLTTEWLSKVANAAKKALASN